MFNKAKPQPKEPETCALYEDLLKRLEEERAGQPESISDWSSIQTSSTIAEDEESFDEDSDFLDFSDSEEEFALEKETPSEDEIFAAMKEDERRKNPPSIDHTLPADLVSRSIGNLLYQSGLVLRYSCDGVPQWMTPKTAQYTDARMRRY